MTISPIDTDRLGEHLRAAHTLEPDLFLDTPTGGLELARLIRMVSTLYQAIADDHLQANEVSGPRWALLVRLRNEELRGDAGGCSPTHLSRCQSVSKNTISALLRGLEEQGLVERALDPDDRRGFRIRLTEAGRALVAETAPLHLRFLNELAAGLTPEEQAELAELLQKLHRSLVTHAHRGSLADATHGSAPASRAS
jgi:DNA-binding MarR family transcriptional regulator